MKERNRKGGGLTTLGKLSGTRMMVNESRGRKTLGVDCSTNRAETRRGL
jgi:hypothetical protein